MSEEDRERTIRRILVALDASPHSMAALQAAAELAAHLDAELLGLYVEDINLLRLADLPLARELVFYSAAPRQVDRTDLEQRLRTQALQARRALAGLAQRAHLRWSFRVAQGMIAAELLAAALESDLIILGKSGWSRRRRLGSTARVIVAQAPHQIMLLQQGTRLGVPVGVVYDGSATARRALVAAGNLISARQGYLVIIIQAGNIEAARELQAEVVEWLQRTGLEARFRWLVRGTGRELVQVVEAEGCGVLVLPAESEMLKGEALTEFLNESEYPVLLVR